MDWPALKPVVAALLLPPAGPLLLAMAGALLALRWRRTGLSLVALALAALWLLSCHAVAIALSQRLLPPALPLPPTARHLPVQAVVVLGGGVLPQAPEYGAPQPAGPTVSRLRYGVWLAQRLELPLAFAGGVGWSNAGTGAPTEAEVAQAWLAERWGVVPRWVDARSRDTRENAREMARLMHPQGVRRIALVTDSWHMPRAVRAFERAGFRVTPAPTGFPAPRERALLEWLPSAHGLALSRQVLREWLALRLAALERG